MSRQTLTIELPENMIATLRRIGEARQWDVGYVIEDAIIAAYREELMCDAMQKYLGTD
jgi:predicted transcriptional regulator